MRIVKYCTCYIVLFLLCSCITITTEENIDPGSLIVHEEKNDDTYISIVIFYDKKNKYNEVKLAVSVITKEKVDVMEEFYIMINGEYIFFEDIACFSGPIMNRDDFMSGINLNIGIEQIKKMIVSKELIFSVNKIKVPISEEEKKMIKDFLK